MQLEQVFDRRCPRTLKAGQAKRVLLKGPLIGYSIACPGCGFVDNHNDLNNECGFVEVDGKLVSARTLGSCMLCRRKLSLVAGRIAATSC